MRLTFLETRLLLWSVRMAPRRADVSPTEVANLARRLQSEYARQEQKAASMVTQSEPEEAESA